eukprot:XP_003726413.1 PREDICTED: sulfotransferase family cytosolic 1B member 1-like [Strongylocentrotus purpuratus]
MDTAEASQTTTNTTNELVTIDILSKSIRYKGVTLPAMRVPDIVESLKDWQTRPDDVLVVTYPKSVFSGSWFRHVKGWFAHKDDPNVLLCKYEEFHKDLKGSIKRVADFLERSLSDEQLDKIVELTEMKGMQKTYQQIEDKMGDTGKSITRLFGQLPYIRKGKVGGWKENFTVAENEYFDKVYKHEMDGSGIEFEFEL